MGMQTMDTAHSREPGPNQVTSQENYEKLLEVALVTTGICSSKEKALSHPVNGEFGVRADFGNGREEFVYVQAQKPFRRNALLERPQERGTPGTASFSELELDTPIVVLREAHHVSNPEGIAGTYAAFIRKLDEAGVLCGVHVMGPEQRNSKTVVDRTYELIRQNCSANITVVE